MSSYRSQNKADSSDDSDSHDSENEGSWKRRPFSSNGTKSVMDKAPSSLMDVDSGLQMIVNRPEMPKKKVNNIWSNVLQERSLTDEFGSAIGIKKKTGFICDRSCESYDYTRKALDTRVASDDEDNPEIDDDEPEIDDEMKANDLDSKFKKLERRFSSCRPNNRKLLIKDENVAKVANRISNVLNEPKKYLIYNIVNKIGPDKALELLEKTSDIELNGGMKIMNGSRRRTPGGVYIQLVKSDPDINQNDLEGVFNADRRMMGKDRRLKKKIVPKIKKSSSMKEHKNGLCTGESEETNEAQTKEAQETMDLDSNAFATSDIPDISLNQNTHNDSEVEEGEIVD